jgi:hypothetical protein
LINNRQSGRRRGRGGGGGGPPRSNPPGAGNRQDNRQRGNAAQLLEKYKGLARDAQMQGDRVLTETYHQYADHYFRVLNESRARFEEQRRQRDDYGDEDEDQDNESGREASDRYSGDQGQDESDYRDEPRRDREPRQDRDVRAEREPRQDREARPERESRPQRTARPERADGPEREDRNGEIRPSRRPRRSGPEAVTGQDGDDERIALDVLPPAISAANETEDEAPARTPRARRPRRPRDEDDIAPAA